MFPFKPKLKRALCAHVWKRYEGTFTSKMIREAGVLAQLTKRPASPWICERCGLRQVYPYDWKPKE